MPTYTSIYDLQKPLVGNATDADLWGGELNSNFDDIDSLLFAGIAIETQTTQTAGFIPDVSISVKKLYPCDATGSVFNVTLPSAAIAGDGATVYLKKIDSSSHAVTILRDGSDTIDGATSVILANQNDVYGLVSDGATVWNSISKTTTPPDASTSVKGIVALATNAEVIAGVDSLKAVVPSSLFAAFSSSIGTNGSITLPGGLILKWGFGSCTGATTTFTFATPFPNAIFMAQGSFQVASTVDSSERYINSKSTAAVVFTTYNATGAINWFAIGN